MAEVKIQRSQLLQSHRVTTWMCGPHESDPWYTIHIYFLALESHASVGIFMDIPYIIGGYNSPYNHNPWLHNPWDGSRVGEATRIWPSGIDYLHHFTYPLVISGRRPPCAPHPIRGECWNLMPTHKTKRDTKKMENC